MTPIPNAARPIVEYIAKNVPRPSDGYDVKHNYWRWLNGESIPHFPYEVRCCFLRWINASDAVCDAIWGKR